MARRCDHSIVLVDDFIEPGGAFVSCVLCPVAMEISAHGLEHYTPFEHSSPRGPKHDKVLLVKSNLLGDE